METKTKFQLMNTAQALRNAIASVLQARDNYDCEENCLKTLEELHGLLFAAEAEMRTEEGPDDEHL